MVELAPVVVDVSVGDRVDLRGADKHLLQAPRGGIAAGALGGQRAVEPRQQLGDAGDLHGVTRPPRSVLHPDDIKKRAIS